MPTATTTLHLGNGAAGPFAWQYAATGSPIFDAASDFARIVPGYVAGGVVGLSSSDQLAACVNQFLAIAGSLGVSPTLLAKFSNGIIVFATHGGFPSWGS
jgi:hypothetical protein